MINHMEANDRPSKIVEIVPNGDRFGVKLLDGTIVGLFVNEFDAKAWATLSGYVIR